jgi:hypothetical protein
VVQAGIDINSFTFLSVVGGTTYFFKVQSRNAGAYSELSSEVTILAATVPSKPASPLTVWTNSLD